MQATFFGLIMLHLGIMHTYICMQKLMKTGYEFERVKEMVYGKIWREEREEKNHTIIISKYKINH